jgi:secretion/DNA translocation related TadE-like protein
VLRRFADRLAGDRSAGDRFASDRLAGDRFAGDRFASDRGAASVWVLAVGLVLVAAGLAGAAVGAVRLARQRAVVAADLAALAGAARAVDGTAVACGRAGEFAAHNGARLVSCTLDGLDLVVTVELTATPLPGLTRRIPAAARAGPVATPW